MEITQEQKNRAAWLMGANDFNDGNINTPIPFDPGTDEHRNFLEGWFTAQDEDLREQCDDGDDD